MIMPVDHSGDVGAHGADVRLESEVVQYTPAELSAADTFAELATELHGSVGVDETLEAVVQFALQALTCTHSGVVLVTRGGRLEIAAVTDPVIETIYQWQIETGEGPVITAAREQVLVRVQDAAEDPRWPRWAEMITSLGIRSVLQVPLTVAGRAGGVLTLFNKEPDQFSDDDEAVAHILARHASIAVATARHEENLAQAVDARKLVGQAMGILMERYDLDSDRAFEVLRRYSQDGNVKLRDVAQQLIDTRMLPAKHRPAPTPAVAELPTEEKPLTA
jgi:transcriptional regulator with GAF, ATPase, and Fis domain